MDLLKNIYIELSTSIINGSNHTKCVYLNNQQCMNQSTLIDLHPHEYTQRLR